MTARCAQTLQPESRAADRRPENFNNRGFAGPIHIRHKIIALLFAHLYPVEIERSAIDDLSSAARGFDCGVEHRMHMDPLLVLKKQTILARIKIPHVSPDALCTRCIEPSWQYRRCRARIENDGMYATHSSQTAHAARAPASSRPRNGERRWRCAGARRNGCFARRGTRRCAVVRRIV